MGGGCPTPTWRWAKALAHRGHLLRWRAQDAVAGVGRRLPDGAVALTFDDGPHPGSTDRVLDVLAELRVSATFFCMGDNARAHPRLLRRIRAEGHAVGSHSLTHPHPRGTGLAALAGDYAAGRRAVEEVLAETVPLFRPPHGHITPTGALMLRRQALRTWLWTVDPEDWRPGAGRREIVTVAARAGPGDVVLLHDWVEQPEAPEALDRSATVCALPEIVGSIRRRGLLLRTLPA